MSDLKCVLVPKWVFVLYEDAPTGVSQVGSECDFCMWHWSLFLCQSGTPVIKKLLRIALTVRLFVGNEMNCSPCLSASMKDLFVFCHFKGLRHSLQSLSFSSWRDWFTVAVTDGCMKKRGWWVSAKKKKKVSFTVLFLESQRRVLNCMCDYSYTQEDSETLYYLIRRWTDYPGALYASISRPDTCGCSSNVYYMCVNNKA